MGIQWGAILACRTYKRHVGSHHRCTLKSDAPTEPLSCKSSGFTGMANAQVVALTSSLVARAHPAQIEEHCFPGSSGIGLRMDLKEEIYHLMGSEIEVPDNLDFDDEEDERFLPLASRLMKLNRMFDDVVLSMGVGTDWAAVRINEFTRIPLRRKDAIRKVENPHAQIDWTKEPVWNWLYDIKINEVVTDPSESPDKDFGDAPILKNNFPYKTPSGDLQYRHGRLVFHAWLKDKNFNSGTSEDLEKSEFIEPGSEYFITAEDIFEFVIDSLVERISAAGVRLKDPKKQKQSYGLHDTTHKRLQIHVPLTVKEKWLDMKGWP